MAEELDRRASRPYADKLHGGRRTRLARKVQGLGYEPAELANGAIGLLGEVSKSKITGEEDRYSHTDLSDFEANVLGLAGGVRPARARCCASAIRSCRRRSTTRFRPRSPQLEPYRRGDGFVSYDTVGHGRAPAALRQRVDALAEPLSKVAAAARRR